MVLLSFLLMPISFMVLFTSEVDAIGAPAITIVLDSTSETVDVSPGASGIVEFTGVVTAEAPAMPPGQVLVVTLQAEAGGWPVSAPPSMEFTNEITEHNFTVSIQIPSETSTRTQGQLTVSGRWSYSPGTMGGTIDPTTAIINIQQYFQYSISPSSSLDTVELGDVVDINYETINRGNGADIIVMEILNKEDLEDHGIIAREKVDEIVIPEKQTRSYPVVIMLSSSTTIGRFEIEVHIYSKQAKMSGEEFNYEITSSFIEVVEKRDDIGPGTGMVDDPDEGPSSSDDDPIYPGTTDHSEDTSGDDNSILIIIVFSILIIIGVLAFLAYFLKGKRS